MGASNGSNGKDNHYHDDVFPHNALFTPPQCNHTCQVGKPLSTAASSVIRPTPATPRWMPLPKSCLNWQSEMVERSRSWTQYPWSCAKQAEGIRMPSKSEKMIEFFARVIITCQYTHALVRFSSMTWKPIISYMMRTDHMMLCTLRYYVPIISEYKLSN